MLQDWADGVKPRAQHEQDHQANGLCMGTPTRHGSRWSLKDLKDAPCHFLKYGLFGGRRHEIERGDEASSVKK